MYFSNQLLSFHIFLNDLIYNFTVFIKHFELYDTVNPHSNGSLKHHKSKWILWKGTGNKIIWDQLLWFFLLAFSTHVLYVCLCMSVMFHQQLGSCVVRSLQWNLFRTEIKLTISSSQGKKLNYFTKLLYHFLVLTYELCCTPESFGNSECNRIKAYH